MNIDRNLGNINPAGPDPILHVEIRPTDSHADNEEAKAGAPDQTGPGATGPSRPANDNSRPAWVPLDGAGLLQQSTLAPGENFEELARLIDDVEEALKPKSLFERFAATDLLNAAWEERRYSQQRLALTAAMRFKALVCLATPLIEAFGGDLIALAHDYFGSDPERQPDVSIALAKYGITDAAINAQAADLQNPAMTLLDRRIASAKSQRNIIVKEFERRTRKAAKTMARKPPAVDDLSSGEGRGLPH
jgi:hypothetical protein